MQIPHDTKITNTAIESTETITSLTANDSRLRVPTRVLYISCLFLLLWPLATTILYMIYKWCFANPEQSPTEIQQSIKFSFEYLLFALPAFFVSMTGGITKSLLSQETLNTSQYFKLLLGSGFIGVLTFLSLKSGLIIDIIMPHQMNTNRMHEHQLSESSFYKMLLLCFISGMFSSRIFTLTEHKFTSISNKITKIN